MHEQHALICRRGRTRFDNLGRWMGAMTPFSKRGSGVYEGAMELLLFLQRAGLESRCCSAAGCEREVGDSFTPRAALREASFSLCVMYVF